jgi:hypothetical protein
MPILEVSSRSPDLFFTNFNCASDESMYANPLLKGGKVRAGHFWGIGKSIGMKVKRGKKRKYPHIG